MDSAPMAWPDDAPEDDFEYKELPPKDRLKGKQAKEVDKMVDRALAEETPWGYPCSSCCEGGFPMSKLMPLYPEHLSWQGNWIVVCFDCVQCKSGPPRPWLPSSEKSGPAAISGGGGSGRGPKALEDWCVVEPAKNGKNVDDDKNGKGGKGTSYYTGVGPPADDAPMMSATKGWADARWVTPKGPDDHMPQQADSHLLGGTRRCQALL